MGIRFVADLVESAALSVVGGQPGGQAAIEAALIQGQHAARLGMRLPLFVLLDVAACFRDDAGAFDEVAENQHSIDYSYSYGKWLAQFVRMVRSRLAVATPSTGAITAMLIGEWPGPMSASAIEQQRWRAAYRYLLRHQDEQPRILTVWSSANAASARLWQKWWGHTGDVNSRNTLVAAMWARFLEVEPGAFIPEQFDHAAAQFYLMSADPPLSADRVKQVHSRRQLVAVRGWPRREAIEHQVRYDGVATIDTAAKGEYGDFLHVNHMDIRLAAFPRAHPPTTAHFHLCWRLGYNAVIDHRAMELHRRQPEGAMQGWDSSPTSIQLIDASMLQGLVALILDDWRAALAGLDVKFSLHRLWQPAYPDDPKVGETWQKGETVGPFSPGQRWKTEAVHDLGMAPPAEMVGHLFKRLDRVELAMPPGDRCFEASNDFQQPSFWCEILLQQDLEVLGFQRHAGGAGHDPAAPSSWSCARPDAIPRPIEHVLIVDPHDQTGALNLVVREKNECCLRPRASRAGPHDGEPPFWALRRAAVDLVVTELCFPFDVSRRSWQRSANRPSKVMP